MKLVEKLVSALFIFGVSASAHAEWAYAQAPDWMTDFPEVIDCRVVSSLISCVPDGHILGVSLVTYVNTITGRMYQDSITTGLIAVCSGNFCTSDNSDVGRVNNWPGQARVRMPRGYYFYGSGSTHRDGVMQAYRFATGPLGHLYPQYEVMDSGNVFGGSSAAEPAATPTVVTYDLWCSPRDDLCNYTDATGQAHHLDREELRDYIPIANDTSDCINEVCYDDNGDVIGLNPERFP